MIIAKKQKLNNIIGCLQKMSKVDLCCDANALHIVTIIYLLKIISYSIFR